MPRIIEITDFTDPALDPYARLTEHQLRSRAKPEDGIFIAESKTVVTLALDAGYTPLSLLIEPNQLYGQAAALAERCPDVPIYTASPELLANLTGFALSRGVLAVMRRPKLPSAEAICADARRICVMEDIMDAANVGAIMRSAAALGMDAVLLTPGCSDPLYRRAARVSMGTVFQIEWTFLPDDSLDEIKSMEFKTVAMALKDNSLSISDQRLIAEKKLAVVMGTEGDGLSDKTIYECDFTVKIPMYHGVDSLNVAAASAVAFYQLAHKQNKQED